MTPAQESALLSLADAAVGALVEVVMSGEVTFSEDFAAELLRNLTALTAQIGALPPQSSSYLEDFDRIQLFRKYSEGEQQ